MKPYNNIRFATLFVFFFYTLKCFTSFAYINYTIKDGIYYLTYNKTSYWLNGQYYYKSDCNVTYNNRQFTEEDDLSADHSYNFPQGTLLELKSEFSSSSTSYTVKGVDERAFMNETGLTEIIMPSSYEFIESSAFEGCSGLTNVTLPASITRIGANAFKECTSLSSISIPYNIDYIGKNAFDNCSSLTSVRWNPTTCGDLPAPIFSRTSITSFLFNSNVEIIPAHLCDNITSLKSIIIPDNVKSIGHHAFNGCTGLTNITIGKSVVNIGDSAFAKAGNIVNITCNATTPPEIAANAFDGLNIEDVRLIIPATSYSQYAQHSIWGNFILEFNGGSTLGTGGFSGSGSGTEEDPYLIFNPIQLFNVHNFTGYDGVVFKLMANIDLTEFLGDNNPSQGWEPIGTSSSPFKGVFHGEGHTISGIFVNRPNTDFVGLFGFAEDATIENLTVEGLNIKGHDYSGLLCGYVMNSMLFDVNTFADISANSKCGGLVGQANNITINNCSHTGNVFGSGEYVGGFAGVISGTVSSCSHRGNVTGQYLTGGFVGNCQATLINICNTSDSISGHDFTGGFAGSLTSSSLQGINSNTINVFGTLYTGGVVGKIESQSVVNDLKSVANVMGTSCVGGFAGSVYRLEATSCYTTGDISASLEKAAGFVGFMQNNSGSILSLTECGSSGNVNANAYLGGLVGDVENASNITISNCFALGDYIASGNYVGGLLGCSNNTTATITNSYYSGKINGVQYLGGIVGYSSQIIIDKNYASGSIRGIEYVGGIAGCLSNSSTVTSCVAIQDVLSSVNGSIGRIYGYASNNCTMGMEGTNKANRAMTTMNVVSEGLQVLVEDGGQHGTSLGQGLLKYKSTYQGLGWDFSTDWTILETESYPYKPSQCAPPKITSQPVAGDTQLSGQCSGGVNVYVRIGNNDYQAEVNGTTWVANLPSLQSGTIIKAYALTDSAIQSYFVSVTVGFASEGTEDDPYLIYTANDLASINSYSYYKLMNNIDLTEWIEDNNPTEGWVPIGIDGGSMKQLDGNGYTISGLWINSSSNNLGLIASMNNATVKNLTVAIAENKSIISHGDYVGIIVGKANNSMFKNLMVSGNISGYNYVGGIAGNSTDCVFEKATINNVDISGSSHVGGITGGATAPIVDMSVKNSTIIALGDYVGGIVGETSADITKCYTSISISGNDYVGGLAGKTFAIVDSCLANVDITGKDYIGGITGHSNSQIAFCKVTGNIVTDDLTNCRAGGIVGYTTGNITNCYSEAYTKGGQYAGGIAGYSLGAINNCYGSGNLYATYFAGGIVGYLDGSNAIVNHCFAINNKIDVSDQNGIAMRVIGGFKNGAPTPQANNYALKSMVVSVNDVTQIIYDDLLEGISLTNNELMQQTTYEAQDWDFTDVWGIHEGNGYPYLQALVETEPISNIISGDVNGDGTVNVSDYVLVANYILEQNPDPFVFDAADADGNGSINVSDLVLVANIALTFEGAPVFNALAPSANQEANISMNVNASHNDDGTTMVSVGLDNSIALTALQMDISLPQGMTVTGAALTDRTNRSHQVEVAELANGNHRLLLASGTSKAFKDSEGALLTLTLSGEPQSTVTFSDIRLASPDGTGYTLNDILLNPVVTGVNEIAAKARIYGYAGNIVIESPVNGTAQLVLPNGMSQIVKVNIGRNIYPAPAMGVVIVRMGAKTQKLLF